MSANSKIEWTESTWSPVTGCTRVSSGCDSCYAVRMSHRLENMGQEKYRGLTVLNGKGDRHFNGQIKLHEGELQTPLRRRKPTTYFVCSMSDLFHRDVPFEFIDRVFAVMALCPQHTFQVLTKRPERMAEYLKLHTLNDRCWAWKSYGNLVAGDRPVNYAAPLPNVWLGTSIENQATADERIPHLLKCPARVRFVSYEPALEEVDLTCICVPDTAERHDGPWTLKWDALTGFRATSPYSGHDQNPKLDWVIVGGESGSNARPCDVAWIRSVVAQCKAAGVACFVKQLGSNAQLSHGEPLGWPDRTRLRDRKGGDWSEWPNDLRVREMPGVARQALGDAT